MKSLLLLVTTFVICSTSFAFAKAEPSEVHKFYDSNGFYISNGQCYSAQNQAVDMAYCQKAGGFGGGGFSCSGYMLLNSLGQQVYCQ